MKYKCKHCNREWKKEDLEVIDTLFWQAGTEDGLQRYCPSCKRSWFEPCIHVYHKGVCNHCSKRK